MRQNFIYFSLAVLSFFFIACEKESNKNALKSKKDSETGETGYLGPIEDCLYQIQEAPNGTYPDFMTLQPTYQDPDEFNIDHYMLVLSYGLHSYAQDEDCESFRDMIYNLRQPSANIVYLTDLENATGNLYSYLNSYFSNFGLNWHDAQHVIYYGFQYTPAVYIDNFAHANPSLPAYYGANVEFFLTPDSLIDFIPARLECQPDPDYYIGKVDLSLFDEEEPEADCLENPIFVTQLVLDPNITNSVQKNGAVNGGNVTDHEGTIIDEPLVVNPAPAPPAGCAANVGENYTLFQYNLANHRYQSSGKLKYYISYNTENGYLSWNYGAQAGFHHTKIEKMKRKHASNSSHSASYKLKEYETNSFNFLTDRYGDGNWRGAYYAVTYEHDGYACPKDYYFDPTTGNIAGLHMPNVPFKAKFAHEYYQVIYISADDWCDGVGRKFDSNVGWCKIYCTW